MTSPEGSFHPGDTAGEIKKITIISPETRDNIENNILGAIKEALTATNPDLTAKSGENHYSGLKANYLEGSKGNVGLTLSQNEQNGEMSLELRMSDEQYRVVETIVQNEISKLEEQFGAKIPLTVRTTA